MIIPLSKIKEYKSDEHEHTITLTLYSNGTMYIPKQVTRAMRSGVRLVVVYLGDSYCLHLLKTKNYNRQVYIPQEIRKLLCKNQSMVRIEFERCPEEYRAFIPIKETPEE